MIRSPRPPRGAPRTLRRLLQLVGLAVALTFPGSPASADVKCELARPHIIADLDGDSARLHTAIVSYIVEHGYGCETKRVSAGTVDALEQMIAGGIDVMLEIWQDNVQAAWSEAEEDGLVIDLGINFSNADQGWYVPRYLIEGDPGRGIAPRAEELSSVFDLIRYRSVFAGNKSGGLGRFMNCPDNWSCADINTKKLRAYGLDEHFHDSAARDGDSLATEIARLYAAGEPFLTYYWSPTWILGSLDLVRLEEPEYDAAVWFELVGNGKAETATAYPPAKVIVGASFVLELEAPSGASSSR